MGKSMTDSVSSNHQMSNGVGAIPGPIWAVPYNRVFKRLGDLILAAFLAPVIVPVIAVMYIIARLDGGVGFYGHVRTGRSGQPFKCWKIRTMVPDAQEQLEALLASDPQARAEWERDRKLRNDPRVTRFGLFFRKSSLDELPQIWNVITGEMSFVGPRPVTEEELVKYGPTKRAYLAMRPGITGLWQVSGRNDVSYDERVRLDQTYHEKASLILDTRILARTIGVLMNRNGF